VYLEFLHGSRGGAPWGDGRDALTSIIVNFSNNPVEVIEAEFPLRIEQYGFLPDTEGAGKHRGGLSVVREYRLLEKEAILQLRADRLRRQPYALAGGQTGAPTQNILNPDSEARQLPGKFTLTIRRDDVFRHILAGAGGWGDPLERDPELVRQDVMDEKITPQRAREAYGVVITPDGQVEYAATAALRAQRRALAG
jgi:N-methylhydantoinase B